MDELNINEVEALDSIIENNPTMMNMTKKKISNAKKNILHDIGLSSSMHREMTLKLEQYKFIDDVDNIRLGAPISWIYVKNIESSSALKLKYGATTCRVDDLDQDINIVCKNIRGKFFTLKLSENILFQKLSDQEEVLLYAMEYINSNQ